VLLNTSFRRSTSCSRALMYISLRSRCVLDAPLVEDIACGFINEIPLCLAVEFLSSCQSGLAIWFGASSLRWLPIFVQLVSWVTLMDHSANLEWSFCPLSSL
jgi:hypothetical protein